MYAWPHMKDLKTAAKKVMSEKSCSWYSVARGQAAWHILGGKKLWEGSYVCKDQQQQNSDIYSFWERLFNRAKQMSRENWIFRFCLYVPPGHFSWKTCQLWSQCGPQKSPQVENCFWVVFIRQFKSSTKWKNNQNFWFCLCIAPMKLFLMSDIFLRRMISGLSATSSLP